MWELLPEAKRTCIAEIPASGLQYFILTPAMYCSGLRRVKSRIVLLGIIAINVAAYILSPGNQETAQPEPAAAEELPPVALPPRPNHLEPAAVAAQGDNDVLRIRSLAFDIAESTVQALEDHPGALCLLGKVHLRSGNQEGARILWQNLIEREPNYVDAFVDMGYLEQKATRHAEAEKLFRRAIELAPNQLDLYVAQSDSHAALGNYPQVIELLERFLKVKPDDAEIWTKLGNAHLRQKNLSEAIKGLNEAIRIDPNFREALNGLATAYRLQGQAKNAAEFAMRLQGLDDSEQRVDEDRDVQSRDRRVAVVYLVYTAQTAVTYLLEQGLIADAVGHLERALSFASDSFELANRLSGIYAQSNQRDSALRVLRSACDLQPEDASRWFELSKLCLQLRRFEPALRAVRRALSLAPNNAALHAQLSQIQMVLEPKDAVGSARRALELQPSANHHYVLATALYHAGDPQSARTELSNALQLAPNNQEYRRALQEIIRETVQ